MMVMAKPVNASRRMNRTDIRNDDVAGESPMTVHSTCLPKITHAEPSSP